MRPLIITFLFFVATNTFAQYSGDPATFLKEIEKRLKASDPQKTKEFMEVFEPNWLSNFTSEYQNRVVETCNLLEQKQRPAFPDIYGYLISVHTFVLTDQPKNSFETWHSTIDKLLNSKKVANFQTFIQVCEGFFTDGTIYDVPKYVWQVRGGTYLFEFENNRPKITFENVDLACFMMNRGAGKKDDPYFDSMIVYKTSGVYEPLNEQWTGIGGKITWARTGLDPTKNFADITDYKLSLKQTKLECDTVTMHTEYYTEPLMGDLNDFAKVYNRDIDRVYPNFTSFSKEVVRKNILPDVDYVGGFAVAGADFSGVGYDKKPAKLIFYENGEPLMKTEALNYRINEKGARASDCRITMFIGEDDSLFHPGLNIVYQTGDHTHMELMRDRQGLAQAPFKDSYHMLDMYVDRIIWTKGDANLNLTWHVSAPTKHAKFESFNYYSEKIYNEIQGMNAKHPLVAIWDYSYKYDMQVIPVSKIAGPMGFTNDQAIPILIGLANQGFITYSSSRKEIEVQPKLKKYIDARAGKSDYDHIVFECDLEKIELRPEVTPDGREDKAAKEFNERAINLNDRKKKFQNFGYLNLRSMDLSLNEVGPVQISPLQNVVLFPGAGELLVKEDLDFVFEGAVMAGKLEVYLNQASFDYDKFRINLMEVDVALLRVRPIYGGSDRLIPMYSHFEGVKGYIQVDDTTNRSGRNKKDFPQFPIWKTTEDSYVFYDHDYIYGGVYDSADFYFKVDPFAFDSLDNFDEVSMRFDGELRSAGILPIFREKIRLMEDYSFGFVTKAPADGFDLYGDYGEFDNEITLSNEGLTGAGKIDFFTSTSESPKFIFFPDSTMGMATYVNRPQTKDQGVSVPDVSGNGVMVTFVPKEEVLKARAVKEPLKFFNAEAQMKGITYLTEKGMTGRGLMYFKEAELGSKKFKYGRWTIDADTCDFNLASLEKPAPGEENPLDFNSNNLNGHVDFEARKGEFKSNDGTSKVEFPKNQYICYMDMFTWLMDNDEMELSQKGGSDVSIDAGGLDLAGSNFFSIHPDQDSLNFRAPKAKYKIKENTIYCDKVEYLDIADARIFPDSMKLTIRKKAEMDELLNAEIVANFITKYHKITEAKVQVKAARDYHASGKYVYVDSRGGEQNIYFADIQPDTLFQTVAIGNIGEEANFHLSDKFDFYGKVELVAANQFLIFNGATRINHSCDQFAKNWLKFRAEIDPGNIQIPVDENMKDLNDNPIAVGLVRRNTMDFDSISIYPTFLSALERPGDFIMFTSSGVLNYNEDAKEFRIASPEKLINREEKGNYIALHIESCSMEGDGLIDLAINLPDVEMKTYGVVDYNAAKKTTTMNLSGGLEFYMDKKVIEFMAEDVKTTEGLGAIDFGRTTLKQAVSELVSKEEAENMKTEYTINGPEGIKKLPKEMSDAPIFLSNLRLEWNDRGKGLISKPITGLVSLFGDPLFKDFTVKFAVQYSVEGGNSGTKLGFLVELPGGEKPGNYYFFAFERVKQTTALYIITSNKEVQEYIASLKEDKTKQKKLSFELRSKTDKMLQFKGLFGE
ncbi:MAG: hypothetical protein H6582_03485 [Crocinitomicaceae bacterium]|nr:hypothetical protein [Crocinitomicaceae bacterium]